MLMNKIIFVFTVLISSLIFFSCQQEQSPIDPFTSNSQNNISKITIPVGAVVDSAMIYINVTTAQSEEVTLHRVETDWDEMTVTWNNFGGAFNASSENSFIPSASDWYALDITGLVTSWVDSTYPNYGILIKQEVQTQLQYYSSRETGDGPYLKIWWTYNGSGGFDSTEAFADSYINSTLVDDNFGGSTDLITGWDDTTEVQSLVRFEIEQEPVFGGCTKGYGYWKTHSAYGPAPYDSTWEMLGEDSTFFLSDKTNYEVMWTSPSGGNAYYMLAHFYIAVQLNILTGADPGDVQEAFDDATDLFDMYTPEDIGALHGNDSLRQQFISLKGILGQYNDGEIGPGTCGNSYFAFPYKTK